MGLYRIGKMGLFATTIVLCLFTLGILGLTAPAWGNEQVATTAIDGDDQPQAINTDDTTWAWECNPDDQSANETADNPQVTTVDVNEVITNYMPQETLIPVEQVLLNKNKISLTPRGSENLTVSISPFNATNQNVTWSSGDTNIATITQGGKVEAIGTGETTITVTTEDGGFEAFCTVEVYNDFTVDIQDLTLMSIIRKEINKEQGRISRSDALGVTSLDLRYKGISNFTGLNHFSNLTHLDLSFNRVQDLGFLADMSNLTELNLWGNQIKDISVLAGLSNLSSLSLGQNQIKSIRALSGLTNLTHLDLAGNQISNIGSLAGLTRLKTLRLQCNRIQDISPLVTNNNNGGFLVDPDEWEHPEIYLVYNYLDISEDSQNAQDIQSLLDKGVSVLYFPQEEAPLVLEPTKIGTVCVVIDNIVDARSQMGLDKADIVYETAVAPGVSRFLAVFDLNKPIGEIGPVRSARRQLVELAAGYKGTFAHCGGSYDSLAFIPEVPIMDFDEIYGSGGYFYRQPKWEPPYNLYTDEDHLLNGIQDRGGEVIAAQMGLPVGDMEGGSSAEQAAVRFYGQKQDTIFSWDAATAKYTRSVNGRNTCTADGTAISADNVIIMFAPHKRYFSNEVQEWVVSAELIGTGTALFYRDGKVWEGLWQKASAGSPVTFTVNNDPMQFKSGHTWIMVDEGLSINSIEPAGGQNNVSVQSSIIIDFTLPIAPGNNYDNIMLTDDRSNIVEINKSIEGKRLTIDPVADLAVKTTYKISIPSGALAFKDDDQGFCMAQGFVSSFTTRGEYDYTLTLGKGWSLISLPRKAELIQSQEEDVEAWLSYALKEGRLLWLYDQDEINNELNNPASAVYIKAFRPTELGFRWEMDNKPQDMFATKKLSAGWNLISTGTHTNLRNILSSLRYEGGSGLTQVFAPNYFNQNKRSDYYTNWGSPLLDITDWVADNLMYPFDGYWVYLRGPDRDYSTVIDLNPGVTVKPKPPTRPGPIGGGGESGSPPSVDS